MRFIDSAEIQKVLTLPVLIDAIEAAHRRTKIEVQDELLGCEEGHYFVRHAVDRGRFICSKLITSFPANLENGSLPAIQAVCVLFDATNGKPLAILDGTAITYWRTAADSALGSKLLALPAPQTLLVVGAGELSRWLVLAHRAVRPSLRRVLIWNRTPERATVFASELARQGLAVDVTDDLDAATELADVITTCTRSHAPLIKGRNLKPGVHLDLVGSYTRNTREADDDAARRALIFVDRRESALAGVGDILQPIASGAITEQDVRGDLYDLVGQTVPGRRTANDVTIFKNAGGGHFDLIAAETIFQRVGLDALPIS